MASFREGSDPSGSKETLTALGKFQELEPRVARRRLSQAQHRATLTGLFDHLRKTIYSQSDLTASKVRWGNWETVKDCVESEGREEGRMGGRQGPFFNLCNMVIFNLCNMVIILLKFIVLTFKVTAPTITQIPKTLHPTLCLPQPSPSSSPSYSLPVICFIAKGQGSVIIQYCQFPCSVSQISTSDFVLLPLIYFT